MHKAAYQWNNSSKERSIQEKSKIFGKPIGMGSTKLKLIFLTRKLKEIDYNFKQKLVRNDKDCSTYSTWNPSWHHLSVVSPVKPKYRGNYHILLSFIQHKSHEITCIMKVLFLVDLPPKLATRPQWESIIEDISTTNL